VICGLFRGFGGVRVLGAVAATWLVPSCGLAEQVPAATRFQTAIPAIPSAEEVIVDLPSAFHAARHQRGDVDGLRYVLFPDGTGKVMQTSGQRAVLYRLDCSADPLSCSMLAKDGSQTIVRAAGRPKPVLPTALDAEGLARYLADWVLAEKGTAPQSAVADNTAKPDKTAPEQSAVRVDVSENLPAAPENTPAKPATPAIVKPTPKPKPVARPVLATRAKGPAPKTAKRTSPPPHDKVAFVETRYATTLPEDPPEKVTQPAPPRASLFERLKVSCAITGSVTLRYKNHSTGSERFGKPRTSLGCSARLSEKVSLRLSAIGYLDKNEKSPSDAEFTYALTYRATDKITLSYANYSGRYSDSSAAFVDSLTSGAFRASYRLPKLKLPNEKSVGCSVGIGLAKPEETRANLSCSYALTKKIRIGASAYGYFSGHQEAWDADFSYTASYRFDDDWSLSYSNYGNNRFFWNKSASSGQGVLGGTLSLTYRFKF